MARTQTLLDDSDIKQAIIYWVDAGCPSQSPITRVVLHFTAGGPRENDEFRAVVGSPIKPNKETP